MKKWFKGGSLSGLFMGMTFALMVISVQHFRSQAVVLGSYFVAQSIQNEGNEKKLFPTVIIVDPIKENSIATQPEPIIGTLPQPTTAPIGGEGPSLSSDQPPGQPQPTGVPSSDLVPVLPNHPLPVQTSDGSRTIDIGSADIDIVLVNQNAVVTVIAQPHIQNGTIQMAPTVALSHVVPLLPQSPSQSISEIAAAETGQQSVFDKFKETSFGQMVSSLPFFGKKKQMVIDLPPQDSINVRSGSVALNSQSLDVISQWLATNGITITPLRNGYLIKHNHAATFVTYPLGINMSQIELAVQTPSGYKDIIYLPERAIQALKDRGALTNVVNPEVLGVTTGQAVTSPSEIVILHDTPTGLQYEIEGISKQFCFAIFPCDVTSRFFVSTDTLESQKVVQSTLNKILDFIAI